MCVEKRERGGNFNDADSRTNSVVKRKRESAGESECVCGKEREIMYK